MNKPPVPRGAVTRREFVKWTVAGAAAALGLHELACAPATPPSDSPPTADGSARGASDAARSAHDGRHARSDGGTPDRGPADGAWRDLAPTCGELTEPNIEGPFFKTGSPVRTNLRTPGMAGTPLRLRGRVLSVECRPVSGALLDFWQANAAGEYDNEGFTLRGQQRTNAAGEYLLETIVPGHYLNGSTYRPAHLHLKVGGAGFLVLTTQLYFAGDPYNAGDPFIRPSLIMRPQSIAGVEEARFDLVLARAP